jgi:glycogen(starch) synthase
MRIVHFSWEYPPVLYGGLGTFATEVSLKQIAYGHEVTVFTMNPGNNLPTSDNYNGVEVYRPKTLDYTIPFYLSADHELKSWGSHFKFYADVLSYNIISASQLVNLLVRKNNRVFDIIHAHDWLGIMGGIVAKKEMGKPLVFHVHSTEIGRSIGRGSHTIKDIEFEGAQIADVVITVSHAMADELLKLGFPVDKIRVCWNGVDPCKYNPERIPREEVVNLRRRYGIQDHELMIFFIGRLVTVKGVDNLVKAFPSILRDYPSAKLMILGVGDLEGMLRDMINQYGLNDKVIIRSEFVSEPERILHYAASDVVVIPSLYEPFGIVCTEAMAMGKPVVVGARGTNGMREQVIPSGEKQCGIHVNPYNPDDIAWGVKEVLKSKEHALFMGRNGRERVLSEFTWDTITKRILDIYQEVL